MPRLYTIQAAFAHKLHPATDTDDGYYNVQFLDVSRTALCKPYTDVYTVFPLIEAGGFY